MQDLPMLEERLVVDDDESRSVRSRLIARLRQAGLWQPPQAFRSEMGQQRSRGEVLLRQLLDPCVGPSDLALLGQARAFGLSDSRLRKRLPLMLSFGYELGLGLQDLLASDPCGAPLCALLNLGVSLFDLQCDRDGGGARSLSEVFDERRLYLLIADPAACIELHAHADDVAQPDLRVLLKVISEVFRRLHARRGAATSAAAWERLARLMRDAYRAQIGTVADGGRDLAGVETKSTAPFHLLLAAQEILAPAASEAQRAVARRATGAIATLFWLVDDIADLARDSRAGAANWLLLQALRDDPAPGAPTSADVALRRAMAALHEMSDVLAGARTPGAPRFRRILLCYVQSWLC
jgi:hypothetical protein